MGKAKFIDVEKSISHEDVNQFETTYNLKLPGNYKSLILKYNGGCNENDDMILDTLYSIKYGDLLVDELIYDMQIVEKNIPKDYFPFALTGTGNIITLSLEEGDNYAKVYLFRGDEFRPNKIAESLEELLGVNNIEEL